MSIIGINSAGRTGSRHPCFRRQQNYGRAFRLESVYTPEIVVNGQAEFLGTDQMRIQREIEKAAQGPRARIRPLHAFKRHPPAEN